MSQPRSLTIFICENFSEFITGQFEGYFTARKLREVKKKTPLDIKTFRKETGFKYFCVTSDSYWARPVGFNSYNRYNSFLYYY